MARVMSEGQLRAIEVWRQLTANDNLPIEAVTLQHKSKSATYRLVGVGTGGRAVIAKRGPRRTLRLEHRVYREALPLLRLPSLRCYGLVEAPDASWLFIDDAGGRPFQARAPRDQALQAAWLVRMHAAGSERGKPCALPDGGPARYLRHLQAARNALRRQLARQTFEADEREFVMRVIGRCDTLESRWAELTTRCGVPHTLVHGDFVSKNLRVVGSRSAGATIVPLDWETAGWGSPASDLAFADLDAYLGAARKAWPALDLGAVAPTQAAGKIFRRLAEIHWATTWFTGRHKRKALTYLRIYEARLADHMNAVV